MTFTPSPRQTAIAEQMHKPGNILVQACAGSGKTTTMVWLASMIPVEKRVLALSFNKAIAEELGRRMPINVRSATMHSVGLNIIKKTIVGVQINNRKLDNIIATHPGVIAQGANARAVSNDLSAVIPVAQDMLIPTNNVDLLAAAVESNGTTLEAPALSLPLVESVSDACDKMQTFITYNEMIRHPAIHNYMPDLHDVVFVDEAQDLNAAQHSLLKKLVKPGGKLIAVGDRYQSVYGFRGADPRSMERLQAEWSMVELPLDVSYRCGSRIVQEAQSVVGADVIKPRDGAEPGEVLQSSMTELLMHAKEEDMILCRMNKPLVQLSFDFYRAGKKAHVVGKDMASQLTRLVYRSKTYTARDLITYLHSWRTEKVEKAIKERRQETVIQSIVDRADTLIVIAQQCKTTQDVLSEIAGLFSDSEGGISLSTIHKAKGLEANTVWIIGPELLLGGKAESLNAKEQERNIRYVAITRAIRKLMLVPLPKKNYDHD